MIVYWTTPSDGMKYNSFFGLCTDFSNSLLSKVPLDVVTLWPESTLSVCQDIWLRYCSICLHTHLCFHVGPWKSWKCIKPNNCSSGAKQYLQNREWFVLLCVQSLLSFQPWWAEERVLFSLFSSLPNQLELSEAQTDTYIALQIILLGLICVNITVCFILCGQTSVISHIEIYVCAELSCITLHGF